ncbi:MAG TPA: type II secretion system F family protein [Actinomycetales bacterium]|nr:type II secretion system F family protein [Actinomycetales bacterium]
MTPSTISLLLILTLALAVTTTAVLRDNRAYRQQMLDAAESGTGGQKFSLERIDRVLRKTSWGQKFSASLAGAGMTSISPSIFILQAALGIAIASLIARPLVGNIGTGLIALALIAGVKQWIERKRRARLEKFILQLPELARLLANGASAGLGMQRSIALASTEMNEPSASELRQVKSETDFGLPLATALENLSRRLPSRELSVLIQTLIIQARAGGTLVSALTNIADTLDDRKQLNRDVKSAMMGASFSGYAVIMIGIAAILLMNLMNPGALDNMIGTLLGQIVLGVSGALFLTGFFLIQRLTKVEN